MRRRVTRRLIRIQAVWQSINSLTKYWGCVLTLSPPGTTVVPYANSLYLDETSSNSASHPGPICLTLRHHFQQLWKTLKHFEVLKQTSSSAEDTLFGGLRINPEAWVYKIRRISIARKRVNISDRVCRFPDKKEYPTKQTVVSYTVYVKFQRGLYFFPMFFFIYKIPYIHV